MPVEFVVRDVFQAVITGVVILGVAFSPIGRALAHRIMHGKPPKGLPVGDDPRVDDLSGEVMALREQLECAGAAEPRRPVQLHVVRAHNRYPFLEQHHGHGKASCKPSLRFPFHQVADETLSRDRGKDRAVER